MIPIIGFGTFRLQGDVVTRSVRQAIEIGYRHIDTATIYENEADVGRGIAESGIDRGKLYITTKVWRDSMTIDGVAKSIDASCGRLGTDYLDMVLIHWPNADVPIAETIGALAKAKQSGKIRHYGVSNFTQPLLDAALAVPGGDGIVNNQIEVHPYLSNKKLVEVCQGRGVQVTGYMPLAQGAVLRDPVLERISKIHNTSTAQIALAWLLARDIIVIPASTKIANQKANFGCSKLELAPSELLEIDNLDRSMRLAKPAFAPDWDA